MCLFSSKYGEDLLIHALMGNPYTYALAFIPFYVFVVLVVVGSSNAVNVTDGLDGLAAGTHGNCGQRADRFGVSRRKS